MATNCWPKAPRGGGGGGGGRGSWRPRTRGVAPPPVGRTVKSVAGASHWRLEKGGCGIGVVDVPSGRVEGGAFGGEGHKWSGVDTPLSSSRACPTAFIASPVPVYMPGCCHVRSIVLVPCLPGLGQWWPAGCGFRALSPASWSGFGPWLYMCVPCWLPSPERCARYRWPHSATHLTSYFHRVMEGLGSVSGQPSGLLPPIPALYLVLRI